MKKICLLGLLLLIICAFTACGKSDKIKIKVAEVAHSVFYAPQYVALEKGFFASEGLDVTLINANGADKVMAALLSKDVQIGLMGAEASIYVYAEGQENYAINFAQLTKKDGSFIVAREKIDDFDFTMMKGKAILGGRKGGMPEMTLEYVLKKAGLDVGQDDASKDVNVRTDVQFAALSGAFVSGEADYVSLFEPNATALEKEAKGYVVASLGEASGEVPYTCYSSLKEYIKENKDVITKFTRAIQKALNWVKNATASEIAKTIHPYFQDTSLSDLTIVMQRYIEIDSWSDDGYLSLDSFNRLLDIMRMANELPDVVDYDKIVDNSFVRAKSNE